ncbi:hypothetical protein B4113_2105 [Geobacillus sp. B4113_201601]|nr:hypothetical protein B4113_2105 [Geobacillus sp. B4113_201601]
MYVLMDSWYPSQALIEACLKQGFHVIAMLKTNRILYPNGIAVQTKEFARYIEPQDTRFVTVGNERYRVTATKVRSTVLMTRWCGWLGRRMNR